MERPDFFTLKNGDKAKLPFTDQEYQRRLTNLRTVMSKNNLDMIILTSMHNIAYYTGFIYCSFGRPYGCIVTANKISTISANIDASQPWRRSHSDNVIYTDWKRDNFLKAIVSIIGRDEPPKNIGIENDHVTLDVKEKLTSIFTFSVFSDVSKDLMQLRMIKSDEEIEIIKNGARIADLGGEEIKKHIKVGVSVAVADNGGVAEATISLASAVPTSILPGSNVQVSGTGAVTVASANSVQNSPNPYTGINPLTQITNIVALTQAQYNQITPADTHLYIITA